MSAGGTPSGTNKIATLSRGSHLLRFMPTTGLVTILVGYGYETPTFADVCHHSFDHLHDDENIRLILFFDN